MPSPRDALRVGRTPLHSVRAGRPHPRSIGRSRMFVCSPPKYWGAHDARPESSYPIPPTKTRAGRRGAPALNTRRSLSFARLSPPPSSSRVEQYLTSLPRLNKGGNEKLVANKRTGGPHLTSGAPRNGALCGALDSSTVFRPHCLFLDVEIAMTPLDQLRLRLTDHDFYRLMETAKPLAALDLDNRSPAASRCPR